MTHCFYCDSSRVSPMPDREAFIFLDSDGVLLPNSAFSEAGEPLEEGKLTEWILGQEPLFHPAATANLSELIRRIQRAGMQPLVVLSSQWSGAATLHELQGAFSKSFGPFLCGRLPESTDRHQAIVNWLERHHRHPKTANFIVIDDGNGGPLLNFGTRYIPVFSQGASDAVLEKGHTDHAFKALAAADLSLGNYSDLCRALFETINQAYQYIRRNTWERQ